MEGLQDLIQTARGYDSIQFTFGHKGSSAPVTIPHKETPDRIVVSVEFCQVRVQCWFDKGFCVVLLFIVY